MKRQDLQNEKVDQIFDNLLEAIRLRNNEIENIVATPQTFNLVKARIKVEEAHRQTRGFFRIWSGLIIWKQRLAIATFAVLGVFLVGVLSISIFINQKSPEQVKDYVELEVQSQISHPNILKQSSAAESSSQSQKMDDQKISIRNLAKRAVFNNEKLEPRKFISKQYFVKHQKQPKSELKGDFYRLTFAGNSEETLEDEQLIQVELSRSSLLAIGVNPPIENETGKFKIDLLMGSDGVVRAFRLIK